MLKGWENVTCKLYVNSRVFYYPDLIDELYETVLCEENSSYIGLHAAGSEGIDPNKILMFLDFAY